ncbi:MAG TPA: CBS domain-containing protein [Aggregatilineaceae bacterium]|nr:CBS domain-containing protein [Aggregatilineaceae bacterium]
MLVKDVMSLNPVTVVLETTHKQASELMREHSIHHLPVLDKNGVVIGIVVEEDLLKAQPSSATTLSIYEIHSLLSKLQIKELMVAPAITVHPDYPLEEAAAVMLKHDIGCLPVIDGQNKLVGIITDTDIFRALTRLLGGGKEGARFTLRVPDQPGILAQVAQAVANAGGNIISATTWFDKEGRGYISIKEHGATFDQLKKGLGGVQAELVDLREKL